MSCPIQNRPPQAPSLIHRKIFLRRRHLFHGTRLTNREKAPTCLWKLWNVKVSPTYSRTPTARRWRSTPESTTSSTTPSSLRSFISRITVVLAVSLITHPLSLVILVCLLGAWLFLYLFRQSDQPLVILGRTFSSGETLLILIGLTVVTVFLTTIGSLVIYAVLVGLAIVCAHGAFRDPEDLFLDDQEQNNIGLLSFLGGDTSGPPSPPLGRV